ncbi:DUF4190 domain-containing protein [Frigoribacterium sp. UYMn621]|uniref:DUF4190 domain-containing protein n=1 Tax=Frigoribacterium sp. UYMn621 TaxID=3156343 RepID=UPI003392F62F
MSELNGVPNPQPSDGQPPVTPPPPAAPDAYAASTPAAPAYAQPYPQAGVNPGRTLGIVGFILAFFVSPAGIIVSAIGLVRSRRAGQKNGLALAGLILSIVFLILTIVLVVAVVGATVALLNQCADLGGGVQQINGVSVTCPSR